LSDGNNSHKSRILIEYYNGLPGMHYSFYNFMYIGLDVGKLDFFDLFHYSHPLL